MKTKKYTAETMVEAMKKVRADFGEDAIILSSSVIKSKGFLGLFQKKSVEVVAGYDEPSKKVPPSQNKEQFAMQETYRSETDKKLAKEMKEMKEMLAVLNQKAAISNVPEEYSILFAHLEQQGLSSKLIAMLIENLRVKSREEMRELSLHEQVELVKTCLKEHYSNLPFGGISYSKRYINVLGPTGVGKTTTVAKIAARALLEKKKKIGFITTDTYRIAAIEQLRTYANLLQAPVEVAYDSKDFKTATEKFGDRDLVFIDTAGRNYKEEQFVRDLKGLIDFSLEMESYLVLSVTSKEQDMRTIIDQFNSIPIHKFIFTKTDETGSYGPIFNVMDDYGIGVAYCTDGQEVPEDITEATLESLTELLMEGVRHA